MNFKLLLLSAGLAVSLSACATSTLATTDFGTIKKSVSVVLMKPDVEVQFDKVGSKDLRVDWTQDAEENLKSAIISHLKSSGESVTEFKTSSVSEEQLNQILSLNEQVSQAMGQHVVDLGNTKYLGTLKHKKGRKKELTYSLGEAVTPIKTTTNADYAVFLTHRSVVESSGSLLSKGAFVAFAGPLSLAFLGFEDFEGTMVNIVDLNTGEIIWLNAKSSTSPFAADARKSSNAIRTINEIMNDSPFAEVQK